MASRRANGWDAFAAREPYFAVLTENRFLRERFDAAAEARFFETGDGYVSDLYATILTSVAPHFAPLSVLEYGCGAGRLVVPFARRAECVTGVDISPSMLDTARHHVTRAGVRGVELVDAESFDRHTRTFDLVNCFLVLQRMRPADGLALLRRLAQRVREGGVGVFHMPYRTRVSPLVQAMRTARARVPGVNAATNVLRRLPASTPFIETNAYELNDVLAILQELHFEAPHIVFTTHGDVDGVIVHALRRAHVAGKVREVAALDGATKAVATPNFIDAREMIANASIDELNRTAEAYFKSLTTWEHHLAKPFANADDAPRLLISLGAVLQGMGLAPGMTVLEFGAGTGWLARFLTQLGCRVILLDVAPTALEIARELWRKQPPIGDRPEPRFLVFDGSRIDLPDASVDRILCFDSFHHAPNPDDVLREFGRVLKPRGVAAFAEPGPRHSMTPESQYEMRTYGVVEADIDIHAIWDTAKRLGFVDLRLAAFHVPPFHVSLRDYDDLLAGGETFARWAETTRIFLGDTRTFFLAKAGTEVLDSRRTEGLRASIDVTVSPARANESIRVHLTVRNIGTAHWLSSAEDHGRVTVGVQLHDAGGALLDLNYAHIELPRALAPGQEVTFDAPLQPLAAGRYVLAFDCVAQHVAWFAQTGSEPRRVAIDVTARSD